MSNYRENATDQIALYSYEVARTVKDLIRDYDFDIDQAIKIVQIGSENIKAETFHHIFTCLYDGSFSCSITLNGGD